MDRTVMLASVNMGRPSQLHKLDEEQRMVIHLLIDQIPLNSRETHLAIIDLHHSFNT